MTTIAVIGLGYVGLPLVVELGKHFPTIGFDVSEKKVATCRAGSDPSRELSDAEMRAATQADYTSDPTRLKKADFILVAVPTPVDEARIPDLSALVSASQTIARNMKPGVTVVYESTVYPGATEDVCRPVLESESGLKWKQDFFIAYSPERINPGERERTLANVIKVVSGDTPETTERVAALYEKIVRPGVHRAPDIRTAEACKVIENTQRDLNIALMNELAIIFDRMGIDTLEVLRAAGTKWNFVNFRPGLVGGHCIGVDPYYLTHKAEMLGYHPELITAGRRINDGMGKYIAEMTVKDMIEAGSYVKGAKVNVLGLTFKENCADIRNTRVADVIAELKRYNVEVFVHDPLADPEEAEDEYGVHLMDWDALPRADAIIAAVAHRQFQRLSIEDLQRKLVRGGCVVDVKACFPVDDLRRTGIHTRRL